MMEMLTNTQGLFHAAGTGHENVVSEKAPKQRLTPIFQMYTSVLCTGMHAAVCCITSPPFRIAELIMS